jgi:methyl-accepting chemotaxis protein
LLGPAFPPRRSSDLTARSIATVGREEAQGELEVLQRLGGTWDSAKVLDLDAEPLAASPPRARFSAEGTDWFVAASSGRRAVGTPIQAGQAIEMIFAAPIVRDGETVAVVAADLDLTELYPLVLEQKLGRTGTTILVNPASQVLVDTTAGRPVGEGAMLRAGSLRATVDTAAARGALAGRSGVADHVRLNGRELISGFAPVPSVGWGGIVRENRDEAFAAVDDQRALAFIVVLIGILVAAGLAYLFARQAARPVSAIAGAARQVARGNLTTRVVPGGTAEFQDLGGSFNSMVESLNSLVARIDDTSAELSSSANQLAAASEQLAATTQEQSTAATETSATMEELARTFTSIAETVGSVAGQTADTRQVLDDTDRDLQASSERVLALAQRVGDVSALLELINEIADQTNLLALNAAIEAARAGESGRGFTVVADEVRRLAERSKEQADQIGRIIEEAQSETNATVMAMEQSSKQMRRGLELMDAVAEATERVRLTTQQQSVAAAQVVDTMESVTEASRQTSTTAQQISASAAQLTSLVATLRHAAESVEARN